MRPAGGDDSNPACHASVLSDVSHDFRADRNGGDTGNKELTHRILVETIAGLGRA